MYCPHDVDAQRSVMPTLRVEQRCPGRHERAHLSDRLVGGRDATGPVSRAEAISITGSRSCTPPRRRLIVHSIAVLSPGSAASSTKWYSFRSLTIV